MNKPETHGIVKCLENYDSDLFMRKDIRHQV